MNINDQLAKVLAEIKRDLEFAYVGHDNASVTGNSYVSGSGRSGGSSTSSSSSSSSSGSSGSSGGGLKAGIKKVVGKIARSVSRGSRNVARRMGESYDWRKEMGVQ